VECWVVGSCNKHVVHVHCQPSFLDFVLEYGIHHCLEGGGGVGHPKEHDHGFVQSFIGDEGGLPFVAFLDAHIVITPVDVKFGEELLHPDAVNQLRDEGQGVSVVDRPFI